MKKIIESAGNDRNRCLIKIMAYTGMRRFEVANIRIEDINFDQKFLHLPRGKGAKARIIPLTRELLENMKCLAQERQEGFLFLSRKDGKISLRQINQIVSDAGRKSGIKNPNPKYKHITCHLFRHSFSRRWKAKGGSIESLSKILGHSSVKTTYDEYGTEDLKTIQENYRKIMEPESDDED